MAKYEIKTMYKVFQTFIVEGPDVDEDNADYFIGNDEKSTEDEDQYWESGLDVIEMKKVKED